MNTGRIAIFDTNVLLLWLVAKVDLSLLRNFKRVSQFTMQDVSNLAELSRSFQVLITTPNVVTEVSNFVDQAPSYRRDDLRASLVDFIDASVERYRPSVELAKLEEFFRLGLADCGLIDLQREATVVTTDSHLAASVYARGGQVVHF